MAAAQNGPSPARALPNALSLACLGLGFLAVLDAGSGKVEPCLRLLAFAALADALAGRAAQGLRHDTPLGAELDALATLLVWGLAAALLAYARGLSGLGPAGLALAGLVAVAAAWRLCKGDLQRGRGRYDGLPPSVAGLMLVAACGLGCPAWGLEALIAGAALLQLAPIAYPRLGAGWVWLVPVFLSVALAALGLRWGWALPELAALAYAAAAPFSVKKPVPA